MGALLTLWGCAGPVVTEAVIVSPAALPLRAYPHILIVPGPLDADRHVAAGLARHLRARGDSRVKVISAARLRAHTADAPLPGATVIVELMVDTDEHFQVLLERYPSTTCDSLGCYPSPANGGQDVPVVRATLHVTTRAGNSMRVLQRLRLRVMEASGDYESLTRFAVVGLGARLRAATEQIPRVVELHLVPVPGGTGVPGLVAALDFAADGDFVRAEKQVRGLLGRREVARLAAQAKAALYFNAGQIALARGGGSDPRLARRALRLFRRARALAPGDQDYALAVRVGRRAVAQAARVHGQRVTAARNHRLAAR